MSMGAVIGGIISAIALLGINIWLAVSGYFLKRQFTMTDQRIKNLQESINEIRRDVKELRETMMSRYEFERWREGLENGHKWHTT